MESLVVAYNIVDDTKIMKQVMVKEGMPTKWLNTLLFYKLLIEITVVATVSSSLLCSCFKIIKIEIVNMFSVCFMRSLPYNIE